MPLRALRRDLGALGLDVVLPLGREAFDRAAAPVTMDIVRPGARGAVLIGDGGPVFFARFRASGETGGADPLDRYTRRIVGEAALRALAPLGIGFALAFPFGAAGSPLPFQRLGRAAGLPPPGPLGLQIHPTWGPWWAYRGLVAVDADLREEPRLAEPCAGCPAPCVGACPGHAVRIGGFDIPSCRSHRLAAAECRESCAARIACIVGPEHRYPGEQLAFHMRASMPR